LDSEKQERAIQTKRINQQKKWEGGQSGNGAKKRQGATSRVSIIPFPRKEKTGLSQPKSKRVQEATKRERGPGSLKK